MTSWSHNINIVKHSQSYNITKLYCQPNKYSKVTWYLNCTHKLHPSYPNPMDNILQKNMKEKDLI